MNRFSIAFGSTITRLPQSAEELSQRRRQLSKLHRTFNANPITSTVDDWYKIFRDVVYPGGKDKSLVSEYGLSLFVAFAKPDVTPPTHKNELQLRKDKPRLLSLNTNPCKVRASES